MALKSQLDGLLKGAADAGDVPGVVAAVTDRNGVIYEGGFGVRTVGQSEPMTADTVGLIASMTKAITATAAMQLIEQGRLDLDSPASRWLPVLGSVQVLEGFGDDGQPRLRAPKQPVTLRHLLTHTSGFGYEFLDEAVIKYQAVTNTPSIFSTTNKAMELPLLFDPGERWSYGIGLDYAGWVVEKVSGQKLGAYFAEHILGPLGMDSTAFRITPGMRSRLAKIHQRADDGTLVPIDLELSQEPEFESGGAGLYGTMGDYLKFIRMILNGGRGDRGQILKPETVAMMSQNQMGSLTVPSLTSANRMLTNDMPLPPDVPHQWGLSFMINTKPLETGRSAGSLMWAGICNSYYWIDPVKGIGGAYLTQILPFADVKSLPLYFGFEATTYQNL